MTISPTKIKHGTIGAYSNHACRCPKCTKANRDYTRDYYRKQRAKKVCVVCKGSGLKADAPLAITVVCLVCGGQLVIETDRKAKSEYIAGARCAKCSQAFAVRLQVGIVHTDELGDPTKCGTEAGHKRHFRAGEKPCEPCALAHRTAKNLRENNPERIRRVK